MAQRCLAGRRLGALALVLSLACVAAPAAVDNPASILCEQHSQTFIKNGTEIHEGKCYVVYTHSSPTHRVLLACK